jgi:hypothetical protein
MSPTKMVEGVNSSRIYSIYCKNFYKCHNVPPPDTTIKKSPLVARNENMTVLGGLVKLYHKTIFISSDTEATSQMPDCHEWLIATL